MAFGTFRGRGAVGILGFWRVLSSVFRDVRDVGGRSTGPL